MTDTTGTTDMTDMTGATGATGATDMTDINDKSQPCHIRWALPTKRLHAIAFPFLMSNYPQELVGTSTRNVVQPLQLSTWISPPICSANFCTSASPKPVPPCCHKSALGTR